MLGCQNCPLMAASCMNLILSSSEDPSLSIFTATSFDPPERSHTPFMTLPNWPEPSCSKSLHVNVISHGMEPVYDGYPWVKKVSGCNREVAALKRCIIINVWPWSMILAVIRKWIATLHIIIMIIWPGRSHCPNSLQKVCSKVNHSIAFLVARK